MATEDFDNDSALEAAEALRAVLAERRHRRTVLGQSVLVPGQLGEALRLPEIIRALQSRSGPRRDEGTERFQAVWESISETSRQQVRERLDWYDPRDLSWDDPRSNRSPIR